MVLHRTYDFARRLLPFFLLWVGGKGERKGREGKDNDEMYVLHTTITHYTLHISASLVRGRKGFFTKNFLCFTTKVNATYLPYSSLLGRVGNSMSACVCVCVCVCSAYPAMN